MVAASVIVVFVEKSEKFMPLFIISWRNRNCTVLSIMMVNRRPSQQNEIKVFKLNKKAPLDKWLMTICCSKFVVSKNYTNNTRITANKK